MRMNEGFFGQYSVFCVFGSVVGCVVVPLIAQVLQQQSMECVILSAIVISLTAAHLNKKGTNDATASYSKVVVASELERKKANHWKKHKSQNHQQQQQHQQHNQVQMLTTAEQLQMELEHMQQREISKSMEVERRTEEKRLKKLKKREERLKKREEETKKQKELEEHYRVVKEKRMKQHKENNYAQTHRNYIKSAAHNLEKFCGSGGGAEDKRCGLSLIDGNRVQTTTPSTTLKSRTITNSNNSPYYQQKIPRFERSRTAGLSCNGSDSSVRSCNGSGGGENVSTPYGPGTNTLTIKCNLSASCSSLSSISSLSSGSASPPMSASAHTANTTAPWSSPHSKQHDSLPAVNRSSGQWHFGGLPSDNANMKCGNEVEKSLKAYSNNRVVGVSKSVAPVVPQKFIPDSSSLFCSQLDGKMETGEQGGDGGTQPTGGTEYSLFGSRGFVTSFAR